MEDSSTGETTAQRTGSVCCGKQVQVDRRALAAVVDHTLLAPEAGHAQVESAARFALAAGCASVCVQSARVAAAVAVADRLPVCAVIGFPHGTLPSVAKARELEAASEAGAVEFDMVVDLGAVQDERWQDVSRDVALLAGRRAAGTILKVILESALWDESTLDTLCRVAADAGADFVKTSTGFHPAGGATPEAVAAMRRAAPDIRVKASGGIRSLSAARRMLSAGADRLGLSGTAILLDELAAEQPT